ncbi:MAG TPA: hypothetical protein VIL19_09465 [Casimicrobiaceae bacterium]
MTNKPPHNASLMQAEGVRCGVTAALPPCAAISRIGNGQQRDRALAGEVRA